jgi:hypothetical protein
MRNIETPQKRTMCGKIFGCCRKRTVPVKMAKLKLTDAELAELDKRRTRWCPDPHRRGRIIPSKKLYRRKPRTPRGVFDF